ncbi:MAG: sugar isomerase [Candidatus Altiarchaeales archaeon]|nr:MAG: sugar isomerase [Candidatus Altiarchaeales archaeon]RLI94343.1 MAG: sugar isomerase [Candidatus Altiarchaeales archaeon]RLI95344.1 MAG: sugar isomerase [Candidatus Altiarchaeales archaeon]HDO82719.1 SIS domain-containing protein [Candidatus Altiarchaeales archaeon]HEX55368.1 SIS domain-containing protein [Candidatus Altiarchaeales archaeon]
MGNKKFSDFAIEWAKFIPEYMKNYPRIFETQRKELDDIFDLIEGSRAIHLYGKGRSANAAISLALRLKHFDYNVWFIGDVVKERIRPNDVVILFSGSGETSEVVEVAKRAKRDNASVISITSYRNSTLAKNSDIIFILPGGLEKRRGWDYLEAQLTSESEREKFFYGGGEFETMAYLFQETLVSAIGRFKRIPMRNIIERHIRD